MAIPVRITFTSQGGNQVEAQLDRIIGKLRTITSLQRGANSAAVNTSRIASKGADPVREAERQAQRIVGIKEQQARRIQQIADRQHQAEVRSLQQLSREQERAAQRSIQMAQQQRTARVAGVVGAAGGALRSTMGTVQGIAASMGMPTPMMAVGNAIRESLALQERAQALENYSSAVGQYKKSPYSTQQIMDISKGLAKKYGNVGGADSVLQAMEIVTARAGGAPGLVKFVGGKDPVTGEESPGYLEDAIKIATAYKIPMADMGGVVAAAMNAGVGAKDMKQLLLDLNQFGKENAIEFGMLASTLPQLAGAGRLFEAESGADMIRTVVGMDELAAKVAVTKNMSRTAVISQIRAIRTKGLNLKKMGIDVEGADGKIKDPVELMVRAIDEIIAGKGFASAMGKTRITGSAAISKLLTGASTGLGAWATEEYSKAPGSREDKINAVLKQFKTVKGATQTEEELNRALAEMEKSPAVRMRQASAAFSDEIDKLLPKLAELAPQLGKLAVEFAKLAVWVGNNPFKGIGLLFTGHLLKELASARIGATLTSGMAGTGGTAAAPVAGMSALGTIAITAAAVTIAGVKAIDYADEAGKSVGKGKFAADMELTNLRNQVKQQGYATPEQQAKAQELAGKIESNPTLLETAINKATGYITAGPEGTFELPGWAKVLTSIGNPYEFMFGNSVASSSGKGANLEGAPGRMSSKEQSMAYLDEIMRANVQQGEAAKSLTDAAAALKDAAGSITDMSNPNNPARNSPASDRQ